MPASCTNYFLTGQSPSTQLTTAQINILLDAHNKARREVKPYARRMPMLQWSQELANMAKEFTGRCLGLTFSDNNRRMNRTLYPSFDWWYVGELLAAGGEVKADNLQAVMDAWLEGGKGYSNPNCAEGVYCGAYKQVIWAETTHVGCAWSYCPNQQYGYYWICNYGVGGNIAGQTPYEVTPYVSESAECTADRYAGAPSEGAKDACDVSYFVTGSSPSPTLTVPQINVLLKGHNDLRRAVTPYANVMPMLQWSQELADFAQEYLDSCPGLVTSPVSRRHGASKFPQWWYVGENMVAGEDLAPDFIGDAILAWSAGGEGWEYPRTCKPGYYCTAFMQMIWAETTHIGCAYKYCPTQPYKYYWVCNYGVGGSIQGESPYAEQRDLTQSASCTRDRSTATASRRAMGARSASFNASKYAVVSSEEVPDLVQSTEPEQETTLAIGTDAPRTKEIIVLAAADVRQIALASYTSPLRVTIAMTAVGLLALALGC